LDPCTSLSQLAVLWSVTLEWIEFGCVHKLYPLNRIVRTSRPQTCNRNRFDSLPVPCLRQYDRLSQQQLRFLFYTADCCASCRIWCCCWRR